MFIEKLALVFFLLLLLSGFITIVVLALCYVSSDFKRALIEDWNR